MTNPDGPLCCKCDADAELVRLAPGIYLLTIYHDDGCPELAHHRAA